MSLDFSREQLLGGRMDEEARRTQILSVLRTIPEEQYAQGYTDVKGKEGWRNPVREAIGMGLTELVRRFGFKDAVELGTALGRSGLQMFLGGLQHLRTVEMDREAAKVAQANFNKAGVEAVVFNMDSATYAAMHEGEIGLLFMDHAKPRTLPDLEALEPWLLPDALVLVDNSFNRSAEMQDAVAYVASNYYASIFTEPASKGRDGPETTGLLIASKDRATFDTAFRTMVDLRSEMA